jgi:hypothetical protein
MKKLFLSLSMASLSLLALATPPEKNGKQNYPYAANQTLQQLYGKVENLKWTNPKSDLLRADYEIDGEKFTSFFDVEGKFVATTQEISFDQLPAVARKQLKLKFQGKEFNKVMHYQSNESTCYYVEVLDDSATTIYKVSSEGSISRFQ